MKAFRIGRWWLIFRYVKPEPPCMKGEIEITLGWQKGKKL